MSDGFEKNSIGKARNPGKGEAYFLYVEPFHGEAQRRIWTFYKAVNDNADLVFQDCPYHPCRRYESIE